MAHSGTPWAMRSSCLGAAGYQLSTISSHYQPAYQRAQLFMTQHEPTRMEVNQSSAERLRLETAREISWCFIPLFDFIHSMGRWRWLRLIITSDYSQSCRWIRSLTRVSVLYPRDSPSIVGAAMNLVSSCCPVHSTAPAWRRCGRTFWIACSAVFLEAAGRANSLNQTWPRGALVLLHPNGCDARIQSDQ